MEVQTLGKRILNIEFQTSYNVVKKVEKITSFNSTVTSKTTGGGGRDYIDIFGNNRIKIDPINVSNTVHHSSKYYTRKC